MQSFFTSFRLNCGDALVLAALLGASSVAPVQAQTSSFQPHAAQPVLPPGGAKPTSPVVESLMGRKPPVLEVRKMHRHARYAGRPRHRYFVRDDTGSRHLERPVLAGVELLQPLPRPGEPSHIAVPVPGYPLDSFITAYTMPAPPIVCHPTKRDPALPDPRLYRERAVSCEADNP